MHVSQTAATVLVPFAPHSAATEPWAPIFAQGGVGHILALRLLSAHVELIRLFRPPNTDIGIPTTPSLPNSSQVRPPLCETIPTLFYHVLPPSRPPPPPP